MSETVTETPIATPETPAEFLAGVADTAPSQTVEIVDDTAATADIDPAPKPDKIERRVANLTRKMGEAERARAAAEARADAAEAGVAHQDAGQAQRAQRVALRGGRAPGYSVWSFTEM